MANGFTAVTEPLVENNGFTPVDSGNPTGFTPVEDDSAVKEARNIKVQGAMDRAMPTMQAESMIREGMDSGDIKSIPYTPPEDVALANEQIAKQNALNEDIKTIYTEKARQQAQGEDVKPDRIRPQDLDLTSSANRATQERLAHGVPFKGATEAADEGYRQAYELMGPGIGADILGTGLGAMGVAGTAFNPVMVAAGEVPRVVETGAKIAGGDQGEAKQLISGQREVMAELQPTFSDNPNEAARIAENFTNDLYIFARKDPVNAGLVLEGVGKLGAKGYAIRQGRLGKSLSPIIAKNFPEVVKDYNKAALNHMINPEMEIDSSKTGRDLNVGPYYDDAPKVKIDRVGVPELDYPNPSPEGRPIVKNGIVVDEGGKPIDTPAPADGFVPVTVKEPDAVVKTTEGVVNNLEVVEDIPDVDPADMWGFVGRESRVKVVGKQFADFEYVDLPERPKKLWDDKYPPVSMDDTTKRANQSTTDKTPRASEPLTLDLEGVAAEPSTKPPIEVDFSPKREKTLLDDLYPESSPVSRATGKPPTPIPVRRPAVPERVGDGGPLRSQPASGLILRLRGALSSIGGRLEDKNSRGWAGATLDEAGNPVVSISREGVLKALEPYLEGLPEDAKGRVRASFLDDVASHELTHASLMGVWGDQWKALPVPERAKITPKAYAHGKAAEIHADMVRVSDELRAKGNVAAADAVHQAIYDSWNIYRGERKTQLDAASHARQRLLNENLDLDQARKLKAYSEVKTPADLMRVLKDNPDEVPGLAIELLRQLKEVKDRGITTEVSWKALVAKLEQWVTQALERLKKTSKAAYEGELGDKLREALGKQDERFQKAVEGAERPLPEKAAFDINDMIQFGEEGTPEAAPLKRRASEIGKTVRSRLAGMEKIPLDWKRGFGLAGLLKSSVHTLRKAGGGLKVLGDTIVNQKDESASLIGQISSSLQEKLDSLKKLKDKGKLAEEEAREYLSVRESDRYRSPSDNIVGETSIERDRKAKALQQAGFDKAKNLYDKMSPEGRALVDEATKIAETMSWMDKQVGVRRYDPLTDSLYDSSTFGGEFFPRILRDDVRKYLENPDKYPVEYDALLLQIAQKRGYIDLEQAERFLHSIGGLGKEGAAKMGSLEFSRTNDLPGSFYEYDIRKVLPTYIAKWAERITQIKHYGQSFPEMGVKDMFERMISISRDPHTKHFLNDVRNDTYGHKEKTLLRKGLASLRGIETILKLASPLGAFVNLSSTVNTAGQFGRRNALKASYNLLKNYAEPVKKAKKAGVIMNDVTRTADIYDVDGVLKEAANKSLKVTARALTEEFSRVHAAETIKIWARDAIEAIKKDPNSRVSKINRSIFEKYGINEPILAQEGVDGPQGRKLQRIGTSDVQFAYDITQLPAWSRTPEMKFFLQFKHFSMMMLDHLVEDVAGPALFGRQLKLTHGKTERVRDFRPLQTALVGGILAGELVGAAKSLVYDRDRKDASIDEIVKTFEDNPKRGLSLAFQRAFHDYILVGTLGMFGDQMANLEDYATRGKTRDLTSNVALGTLDNLWKNILEPMWQQKRLIPTLNDFSRWIKTELPVVNQGAAAINRITGNESSQAQKRVQKIRQLGYRFIQENDLPHPASQPEYAKTPKTPLYDRLQDALMTGDLDEAKEVKELLLKDAKNGGDKMKLLKGLRQSVVRRQPFKVGAINNEEEMRDFRVWVLRRAGQEAYEDLLELDKTYQNTAREAGLMTMKLPSIQATQNLLNRAISQGKFSPEESE